MEGVMLQGRFVSIPETDCTNVRGTARREERIVALTGVILRSELKGHIEEWSASNLVLPTRSNM